MDASDWKNTDHEKPDTRHKNMRTNGHVEAQKAIENSQAEEHGGYL